MMESYEDSEAFNIREGLLNLIDQQALGLEGIAIVCETVAKDCKWNIWFLEHVKKNGDNSELMRELYNYDEATKYCFQLVKDYKQKNDYACFKEKIEILGKKLDHR